MSKIWSEWNLEQWLYRLENRTQQEIQLGLTRISQVAAKLHLLKPRCKVITVTGTNGKGSTVAALETLYHLAGFRVGAYTSPHLLVFNERIRVNREQINDEALCALFCLIEEARGDIILTYFEMATLAALLHFSKHNLDIMILEVGIGGRLDATNMINPDLAIITTVDFDHQDFLGDSLEAIGYEKAGILREGIPFIYADMNPPKTVVEAAHALDVKACFYSEMLKSPNSMLGQGPTYNDFDEYTFVTNSHAWEVHGGGLSLSSLPYPKIQLKSAAAAIMACHLLNKILPVSTEVIRSAMESIFVHGRLQMVQGAPSILYDVSHNPQSAALLANYLAKIQPKRKIHAVFSALKDKDIAGLIAPVKDYVHHWYPALLDSKRAASACFLLSKLKDAEIYVEFCYTNPLIAFEAALEKALADDLIVVFGSFYTVGQVMAYNTVLRK